MSTTPRYEHEDVCCTYLGQFEEFDLYVCGTANGTGTYLARDGDDGSDYHSGKAFVGLFPPITEAHRLAAVQGIALDLGY